jgi:hypothetical protein
MTHPYLLCDGCGQPASSEHTAKRLQRLESMTRYRPIHIGTVLLGAFSPRDDGEFLYAETGEFAGEAKHILAATGISSSGKSKDATLAEFQRGGFLLAYVLECPLDPNASDPEAVQALLRSRVSWLLARIRRSFRPKRLAPISWTLEGMLSSLQNTDLGCALLLNNGKPFAFDAEAPDQAATHLRKALDAVAVSNC